MFLYTLLLILYFDTKTVSKDYDLYFVPGTTRKDFQRIKIKWF